MGKHLSQVDRLALHLAGGKKVTRLQSFNDLGICELSSRVKELEQRYDVRLGRKVKQVTNRFGEKVRVIEYSWPEKKDEDA